MTTVPGLVELWLVELDRFQPSLVEQVWGTVRGASPTVDAWSEPQGRAQAGQQAQAHAALRLLLARHAGIDAARAPFEKGSAGKPRLAIGGIHFSLAHSGTRALIAISREGEIGIDLEAPRASRISGERREQLIAAGRTVAGGAALSAGTSDEILLQAWVRLEAMAKVTGEGMGRLLTRYQIAGTDADRGNLLAKPDSAPGAEPYRIRDLVLDRGYVAAVAGADAMLMAPLRTFPDSAPAIAALLA